MKKSKFTRILIITVAVALIFSTATTASAYGTVHGTHDHCNAIGVYALALWPDGELFWRCYNMSDGTGEVNSVLTTWSTCCGFYPDSDCMWKACAYSPEGKFKPYRARIGNRSLIYCNTTAGIVGTGYVTSGFQVTSCQDALFRLANGYLLDSDVDGIYGPITKSAIILFQTANPGLVRDGICGRATWGLLAGEGI